jgi:transposase-like protein
MEAVMCEEVDAFIAAAWGEQSPKRQGHRNGFYRRDLVTIPWRVCVEIGF